jgi:hypothetical protein
MAVRFETTVYNEKGRKINVAIKDLHLLSDHLAIYRYL